MSFATSRPFRLPALLALAASCLASSEAAARSAVFGGGPFYRGGQAVMNELRASGFTTVMIWSIHVRPNGDLWLNDDRIVANGAYVGDPGWPARLRTLKQAPTSVSRIEVSVGSAAVQDWHNIRNLIRSQGTGPGSILYRNFRALKAATGADAANDDDEDLNDVATTVAFGRMVAALGYKFTLCPYTNINFWASVKNQLGTGIVDRVYLQNYAGGAGNNPATWRSRLGMNVDPGLWCRHGSGCSQGDTPARFESRMRAWRTSAGIVGGFMWLFDDTKKCPSQGTAAQYARAINRAVR